MPFDIGEMTPEKDMISPMSTSVSLEIGLRVPLPSSRRVRESGFAIGASSILVTFTWNVKVDVLDSQASSVTRKVKEV